MPAKSKSQQRLMGMVYAYKKGELDLKELPISLQTKIKDIAKSMKDNDVEDFAKTKHKNLPEIKDSYIPTFDEFVNEALRDDQMHIYKIKCRDSEGTLKELIEYIGKNGNGGHSFEIVVDPDMTEEEGKKSFFWDGDGADFIQEVIIESEPKK